MVAQTRTSGQDSPKKLKFHDKLVGKGLSTDALLKKLKALHTELATLDQELVDVNSLSAVRKELISTSILLHRDRGVKAFAASCLADLLRLYAPDAPYTQDELQDIFQFFITQLSSGLTGTDAPYYNEYFHLLESLSTVKSVVLVCDLPQADDLMVKIFREFFGLVRRDLAKKIELFIADILIALLDECHSLPDKVLSSIMAQFMDKNKGMDQPNYRLAVQICNATADKLQRHVCQYFTDIIVQHSRDEDFDEVHKAHDLIKQLNRSCPSLLHNVVPQLEEELRVEENQIRIMATQVLGEMFADKGGAEFVKKYPTTWNYWLQRMNDKASVVRLAFVEAAKGALVNLPEMRNPIEEALRVKLLDPDEKIRAAVCKLYSQLDYEVALHHVSEEQLKNVAGRGLDKKHLVRVEAMNAIAQLHSLAYPEIENNDPAALQHFAWIPERILHMSSATVEVKAVAEQVIAEYILPLPSPPSSSSSKNNDVDEAAWTDRLLLIMRFLDDSAINALLSFSGLKASRPTGYERFLQCCIEYNGGVMDENEEAITDRLHQGIKRMAALFPDPHKAAEDLHAFAKLNESRLYKMLKTCMDVQVDLKSLVKSTNEFMRRVESLSASIVPTMSIVLRRSSLRIVNQSSIPTFIKRVQKGDSSGDKHGLGQERVAPRNAQIWMNHISKHCPSLFQSHVSELSKAIANEKNKSLVEICLQALAALGGWDTKLAPGDKRTVERAMRFVMQSNARHAKFAARLLVYTKNSEELCEQVVKSIADGLAEADSELLVAHIAVLAEFALKMPDAFEPKSDVIIAFLLKQVLMAHSDYVPPMDIDEDKPIEEWYEDDEVPPDVQTKVLSLKVCRNRCLAHAASETALEIAKPALKMFATLLQYDGSLNAEAVDDPKTKSRMRLQAAISMLHLANVDAFLPEIMPSFVVLGLLVQDACFQVRMLFMDKLVTLLTARKLPVQFNVLPFMSVHDPEADIKNKAKAYVIHAMRTMPKPLRLASLEMIFIRLLHLLAHHPDWSITKGNLRDMAKCIDFYLDLVASNENIALLYYLAVKAKTVRDAESHAHSENLYAASELAQHLIKTRAKLHSWSLESYPGKVRLPGDILRPLPNPEAAKEILKTVYLSDEAIGWLTEQPKQQKASHNGKEKRRAKRKAASKANGHVKRKRRRADDSGEEESSPSEASDEDNERSASPKEQEPPESDEDADQPEEEEEKLGRGARTRAKAKMKQQATKRTTRRKAKAPSSDD